MLRPNKILLALLACGMIAGVIGVFDAQPALAKGGSGSSGRSYSSGGSSSSRSSSGGSSSRGSSSGGSSSRGSGSSSFGSSSFSSPSSSGSRGYSSGSSSSGSAKPGSSNWGSSSFGGSSSRPASPSGGSFSNPNFGGSSNPNSKSGSTRDYSSGSNPASGNSTSSSGRTYGSGSGTSGPRAPGGSSSMPGGKVSSPNSPAGTRPRGGDPFDSLAAREKKMADSRAKYERAQEPRPSYVDNTGKRQTINPTDPRVGQLRRELDRQKWINRDLREQTRYGGYYTNYSTLWPVGIVYHDSFSNYFWLWLMAQSLDTRASWAYNHYDAMDQARYREMLARDANLEARIRQLEAEQSRRNPTYVPSGIDADLMYNDEYVDAVYNPTSSNSTAGYDGSTSSAGSGPRAGTQSGSTSFPNSPYSPYSPSGPYPSRPSAIPPTFLHTLFTLAVLLGILAALVWLVFYKRWGGDDRLGRW